MSDPGSDNPIGAREGRNPPSAARWNAARHGRGRPPPPPTAQSRSEALRPTPRSRTLPASRQPAGKDGSYATNRCVPRRLPPRCRSRYLVFVTALPEQALAQARRAASGPAAAATVSYDPSLFDGLEWRNVGPNRGGRSIAVAGSSARPLEYYFGATGGGLWKTTDGGTTWQAGLRRQVHQLVRRRDRRLRVEPGHRLRRHGRGAAPRQRHRRATASRSPPTRARPGRTWGSTDTRQIGAHPHPSHATPTSCTSPRSGHAFGPNEERGVFKTTDGGKTWKQGAVPRATRRAPSTSRSIRRTRDVMYAGFWQVVPHAVDRSRAAAPGSGLFKSHRRRRAPGRSSRDNAGLPNGHLGQDRRRGLAARTRTACGRIVEADAGGVFRSDDAGATWTQVNDDRKLRQRAFYYTRIYADPQDARTRSTRSTSGFYRSTRRRQDVHAAIRVPHGDNHDLWIAPNDPKRMIEANDGGANVSFNGGETWTEQDYPTAQFYHVIDDEPVPVPRLRRAAGQLARSACRADGGRQTTGTPWAAARAATSRRIPTIRTSSTPAATAGCSRATTARTGQRARRSTSWPDNPMGHSSSDIQRALPVDVPDRVLAHGPEGAVRRLAAPVEDDERGQSWTSASART